MFSSTLGFTLLFVANPQKSSLFPAFGEMMLKSEILKKISE
jgi:hypothetical protein